MKTLTIYSRIVLERTGYRKYPYKEVNQISIFYSDKKIQNHYESIDNPRLRVKFNKVFETRKKSDVKAYINKLGRTDSDKWLKANLSDLIK